MERTRGCREQPLSKDMWTQLPEPFFAAMLEKLSATAAKTLRLTCKRWRLAVDDNIRWLEPRSTRVMLCATIASSDTLS